VGVHGIRKKTKKNADYLTSITPDLGSRGKKVRIRGAGERRKWWLMFKKVKRTNMCNSLGLGSRGGQMV